MKNDMMIQTEDGQLCRLRSSSTQKEFIRLEIDTMGLICKPIKKAGDVLPNSKEDDCCDLDMQLSKDSRFDQDDFLWLSSDCSSPSSFFNNYGSPVTCHLTASDWSCTSPVEEASLALGKTISFAEMILPDDLEEKEVVTLTLSFNDIDTVDSSISCISSPNSFYKQSSDDLTGYETSSTIFIKHFDSPPQNSDLDRTGFGVSLLNPNEEDSKWISDTESELDCFQSDFPSPSFKSSSWGSSPSGSSSSESNHEKFPYDLSSEHASEAAVLEDLNGNDPLFWPFEQKFSWTTSDCFSMSPCKDVTIVTSHIGTSPRLYGIRPHEGNLNPKEECKQRFVLRSPSTASKILQRKQNYGSSKCVKRTNPTLSRLHKSSKGGSMKIVPLDTKDDEIVPKEKSVCTNPSFLEEELEIESLLGLDEFDGHEGVDLEFNKDDFFFDESF